MAKGDPLELKDIQIANVVEKSGQRGDNKGEWRLWKATFVGQPATFGGASTFSSTCGKLLLELAEKKTPAVFQLAEDKEFQGKMEYSIEKVLSAGDGKTVLYEPDASERKRGGGGGGRSNYVPRPDWTYRDRQERDAERYSIEAQTALQYAVRTMEAVLPYEAMTAQEALDFVARVHPVFTDLIRNAVSRGGGSENRPSRAGGTKGSQVGEQGGGDHAVPHPAGPTASAPAGHDPDGRPSSEPPPVDMSKLVEKAGNLNKAKIAFRKHHNLPATVENLTQQRIDEVVEAL